MARERKKDPTVKSTNEEVPGLTTPIGSYAVDNPEAHFGFNPYAAIAAWKDMSDRDDALIAFDAWVRASGTRLRPGYVIERVINWIRDGEG